jgi:hypothetical protein
MCLDGARNGEETDIDCGGPDCPGCFGGATCSVFADCATGSCAVGKCEYLRSCRELLAQGRATSDEYWVDFDGEGPGTPAHVYCDQSTDGGGWMLAMKVHRAERDDVTERRETLRDGHNPHLLLDSALPFDRGLASHGTVALSHAIGEDAWARITIVAAGNESQTATWFKRVSSAQSLARWFVDDAEPSPVCDAPSIDDGCRQGVIAQIADVTILEGLSLADRGYHAAGDLSLRLASDDPETADIAPFYSGVCSATTDDDGLGWNDTLGSQRQWGNGLLLWLR